MSVPSILQTIYQQKVQRLAAEMKAEPEAILREKAVAGLPSRRPFLEILRQATPPAVIAETKRSSPSAGVLAHEYRPADTARLYDQAGATAVSVLTEQDHFGGSLADLEAVRAAVRLPLLRKDFLSHPYQVVQAAAHGADAILAIVAGLEDQELEALLLEAERWRLAVLVEVHTAAELTRARRFPLPLVGINNRDLHTFTTDLGVTDELAAKVPAGTLVVSESGIRNAEDVRHVLAAGAEAVLIGEALMRDGDPGRLLRELRPAGTDAKAQGAARA